jgi:hypothetical protein
VGLDTRENLDVRVVNGKYMSVYSPSPLVPGEIESLQAGKRTYL